MFNIVATICFLQLTTLPTFCFKDAVINIDFKTENECLTKRNMLVYEINQDLIDRNVSMFLYCQPKMTMEETNV
tara:strand:- start:202 stop:423 length:222 start_codon:yes stop_codon:yes gene_type:complete